MRVVVHDYAGHPFQVHLSRNLAKRGHDVTHVYSADNQGPKGVFESQPGDSPSLNFVGVSLGRPSTHAAGTGGSIGFARRAADVAYGREAGRLIQQLKPDVVLSGNTPTEAQQAILKTCKIDGVPFVYWLQDVYSVGVSKLLTKKLGVAGKAIGWYYQRLDRRQFRDSDAIVAISEDFVPLVASWIGSDAKVSVIENWASIDDIPVGTKNNDWAREHNLSTDFSFIYSGTLGRKHNPMLLAKLAQDCGSVVVVGQGYGVPVLQKVIEDQGLDAHSLTLLPIQPAKYLADVLATSDVLMATIEPDAGTFAVPSKVLSYLCAGRPILLSAPKENLAARIVKRANAGVVVDPDDTAGFIAAAMRLHNDPQLRATFGGNGRDYAERVFDIGKIVDQFEVVLHSAQRG